MVRWLILQLDRFEQGGNKDADGACCQTHGIWEPDMRSGISFPPLSNRNYRYEPTFSSRTGSVISSLIARLLVSLQSCYISVVQAILVWE
jgi:hypothetical protein